MSDDNVILWLCFKVNEIGLDKYNLEVIGLFSTEELARKACKAENYIIGPIELDKLYPEESIEWSGAYYPLR